MDSSSFLIRRVSSNLSRIFRQHHTFPLLSRRNAVPLLLLIVLSWNTLVSPSPLLVKLFRLTRQLRIMEWLGRAKINFTHSPSPAELQETDGSKTNVLKIVEQSVPPCQMNPLLFNGHIQTIWTATKQHGPPVYYRRKLFQAEDKTYEGTFAVDFVTEPFEEEDDTLPPRTVYYGEEEAENLGSDDDRPQLVVLHGLSGGSHEIYLRHCIAPLVADKRWEVCVVNSRGCAMSPVTSGVLYNARATWDFRHVRLFRHLRL